MITFSLARTLSLIVQSIEAFCLTLSEEFLLELKGMEHKNVALEVLKKLLNDELKSRSRKNLVKSKSLMEMRGIKLDQTSFYRLKKGDFLFNIHRLFMRYGNGKGFR
jgi:type I site-specific restriction-modification system R (restriction) subunit